MSESYFQFLNGERINSSHWSIGWIVIKMWFIGRIQKRNCSLSARMHPLIIHSRSWD